MEIAPEDLARAIGRDPGEFRVEPIAPDLRLHSITGGVHRISGEGFSLVVKVVRNGEDNDPNALWVSGGDPSHRNYWKREWLAFASGFLDALPGELRAPRTLLTTESADGEAWIWMEDVEGRPGDGWQIDDYDSAAFDLGTTQAAFASGRVALPGEEWLSRGWLGGWVDILGAAIDAFADDPVWASADLAPIAALHPRLQEVWNARGELMAIVESAPQTVVHLDLWPSNLIAADDGTTVALDWSQVGVGAVAQDLDQTTLDPVWMRVTPGTTPEQLEAHVLPGYVSGLRSSGFDASPAQVRRWYAAAASLHYAPMHGMLARAATDPATVSAQEARWGVPFGAIVAGRAEVIAHAVSLGEEVLGG